MPVTAGCLCAALQERAGSPQHSASLPTTAWASWVTAFKSPARTLCHLTILTLRITMTECRQIAEQSARRVLSLWFIFTLILVFVGVTKGVEGGQDSVRSLKVQHMARTRNSTKCHSPLFLFKWMDKKTGLLLRVTRINLDSFLIKLEIVP